MGQTRKNPTANSNRVLWNTLVGVSKELDNAILRLTQPLKGQVWFDPDFWVMLTTRALGSRAHG